MVLVLLALGFNAALTGRCCSGGLSGVLLPLMDSIVGATVGEVSDCFGRSICAGEHVAGAKARRCPQKIPVSNNGAPTWRGSATCFNMPMDKN